MENFKMYLLNGAKNQYILLNDNIIIFRSYESNIAKIENNKIVFFEDWDYSKTTLKYLYLFLNEYLYKINDSQKFEIMKAISSKNKKQYLQKIIENKIIEVK